MQSKAKPSIADKTHLRNCHAYEKAKCVLYNIVSILYDKEIAKYMYMLIKTF